MSSAPSSPAFDPSRGDQSVVRSSSRSRWSQAGFSLPEVLVALLISVLILLVAMLMFDVNTRVSRVQGSVTDMQQAQRIVHNELAKMSRMAGRGGLPIEWALAVTDNVDEGGGGPTTIGGNDVLDATDIVTIRGVFNSPIYQLNAQDDTAYDYDGATGTISLRSLSPTGVFQSLEALDDASAGEALILVSPVDDGIYAVVELTNDPSLAEEDLDGDGETADGEGTIDIEFSGVPASSANNTLFMAMSAGGGASFPTQLEQAIAFVGILEEYRYYIRDDDTVAGGYSPKLTRARFFPNTDGAHPAGSLTDDIADEVVDLQLVRALDVDNDGEIDENPADTTADEWLGNNPDDDFADAQWVGRTLLNVRLTTLSRTSRPDRGYMSPPLVDVENHTYDEPAVPADLDQVIARSYRRRQMQTVIDLRNFT